jgi:putative ABC transport system permease protein
VGVLKDLQMAFRMLLKRPGFALAGLVTLALGIGANTAVFSVIEAVLLRPLPVKEPERLVAVWEWNVGRGQTHNVVNPANYLAWKERARSLEALSGFARWSSNLTGDATPARVSTGIVTADLFRTLGVAPALGRGFEDKDAVPGAEDVVVLSDGLWSGRFGRDPGILDRRLTLNGRATTVVGVMPPGFSLPSDVELWVPLPITEPLRHARGRWLSTIGRLRPGVSVAEARAEMVAIAAALEKEDPDRDAGWSVSVAPLHADLVRDVRPAALVLAGAVALVLLIACGNLATLLLARALGREREIAVRRALGASRGRLVRQLLGESVLLAAGGGALGVLLSPVLVGALLNLVPEEVRLLFPLGVDGKVLAFTAGVSLLSAVGFGLLPALSLTATDIAPSLREGSVASGVSRARRRLSSALVAAEIALSVLLLAGAGLLVRSFDRLTAVDPGFDPSHALTFDVTLSGDSYRDEATVRRFYEGAVERLGRIPGVSAAGAISWRPIGTGSATSFVLPDRPLPPAGQEPVADVRMVTPGLFRALGIPLLRGRDFTARDDASRAPVVVVNEGMAREYWPGHDPIGRHVRMEWGKTLDAEVVGVVGDVRLGALDTAPRATLYWAESQLPNEFMTFVLRTEASPRGVLDAARAAIASIDKDVPLARVGSLEAALDDSLRRPRFVLGLLAAFAGVAASLAAVGLFALLSYAVAQRVRELGVRLALGARPADVRRLVLGEGLRLAAVGLAAGLALALALTRLMSSLLYEVSPRDPPAFAAVAGLVFLVSLAATAWPARRASRIDPARALRAE